MCAEPKSFRIGFETRPPRETAVFWINRIAATKGAVHLHSVAAHFNWFLYSNLDVWILFAIILWLIVRNAMSTVNSIIKLMPEYSCCQDKSYENEQVPIKDFD